MELQGDQGEGRTKSKMATTIQSSVTVQREKKFHLMDSQASLHLEAPLKFRK